MSIVDGQRVRAAESNAAWASKQSNNTMLGVQTLSNAGSGPSIPNVQQRINDIKTDLTTAQNDISTLQTDVAALQAVDVYAHAGLWDASTNTPTLADGDGALPFGVGAVYRVSVAGTQDLGSGSIVFVVGDRVVYNSSGVWEKWDVNDADIELDDLIDVNAPTPVTRALLQKSSTDWVAVDPNEVETNSTLTGAAQTLPATDGFFKTIRLTNASLTSIRGIGFTYNQQKLILVNATGSSLDVLNESGSPASERIITGLGSDLALDDGKTLLLIYDSASSRWRIIGGTGSGGAVGYQEVPAGVINGVNVTFGPLSFVPSNSDSVLVYIDGILLRSDQWSLSGLNVVLDVAPVAGQEVYVFYVTQGVLSPPPVISGAWKTEYRTLTAGEITAKQLTLAETPVMGSEVQVDVKGGSAAFYGDAFIVSGDILDWSTLELDGILAAGDKLRIGYVY